jgi:hypothetical protein
MNYEHSAVNSICSCSLETEGLAFRSVSSPPSTVFVCSWSSRVTEAFFFACSEECFPCHLSLASFEDKLKRYFRGWGYNRQCEVPTDSVFCNLIITFEIFYPVFLPEHLRDWRGSGIIILIIMVNFMLGEMVTLAYWTANSDSLMLNITNFRTFLHVLF